MRCDCPHCVDGVPLDALTTADRAAHERRERAGRWLDDARRRLRKEDR